MPKTRNIRHSPFPPWFTFDIINKIKFKWKLWSRYKRSKSLEDLLNFKSVRSEIKRDVKIAYRDYICDLENNIKANPNKFWTHISRLKKQGGIPSQMSYNNKVLCNPADIVNAFATHFSSGYTDCKATNLNEFVCESYNDLIQFNTISEADVFKALKKIKCNLTSGHDNIPGFLLSDCASVLSHPLSVIFNLIINSAIFPDIWKHSIISPIFKKGSRNTIENYRPISLICNFAKVFEFVLHKFLLFNVRSKISDCQHGFVSNRSTISNLCVFTQFVSESFDAMLQVDVAYTDFSKAFDKLNHDILLVKLSNFGFSASLLSLFKSYLSNRTQCVKYNGHVSDSISVLSGVPQGSVLGPLLFVIYINDIAKSISSNILMYADDLKIFRTVSSINDCRMLQDDLQKFLCWSNCNFLPVNFDKCFIMSFTNKNIQTLYPYDLNNTILTRVDSFCDLGVTFDSKLSFVNHINNICANALKSLGFILRCGSSFSDFDCLKILYFAYVRSKLEYASVVWSPFSRIHIDTLEKIQRRFLKYLAFRADGVYPPRGSSHITLLNQFGFRDLHCRRTIASLNFLKKLVHFHIDCPDLLSRLYLLVPRLSSRSHDCFYLPTPRLNVVKHSPIYEMCTLYNSEQNAFDIFK